MEGRVGEKRINLEGLNKTREEEEQVGGRVNRGSKSTEGVVWLFRCVGEEELRRGEVGQGSGRGRVGGRQTRRDETVRCGRRDSLAEALGITPGGVITVYWTSVMCMYIYTA